MSSQAVTSDWNPAAPAEEASSASPLDENIALGLVRVVERAAIAAAATVGHGDRVRSDEGAVQAMRTELDRLPIDARIVIGEGERDDAPMLYIGERLGARARKGGEPLAALDVAVDPLEGTNLCVTGEP